MRKEEDHVVFHLVFHCKKPFSNLWLLEWNYHCHRNIGTGIAIRPLVQHVDSDIGSKHLRKKCRNSAKEYPPTDWKHFLHFSSLASICLMSFFFFLMLTWEEEKKKGSNLKLVFLYKVSILRSWYKLIPIATKTVIEHVWVMLFSVLCVLDKYFWSTQTGCSWLLEMVRCLLVSGSELDCIASLTFPSHLDYLSSC